nr:translation initiation factor IF-2-like [Aegilops tauschii subsp. strangulata]
MPEKKSRLPRPKPRLRRCSPPSSLPQKPPCTSSRRKHQRDQILQDGALKRGATLKTTPPPDPEAGSGLSPEGLDPGVKAVKIPDDASKEDSDAHRRRRRRPVNTGQAFTRCSHSRPAGRGRPVPPLDRAPPTQRAHHCCVGPPANLLIDGPAETRSGPAPRIHPRPEPPCSNKRQPGTTSSRQCPSRAASHGPPANNRLLPAPWTPEQQNGAEKLPILCCQGRIRGIQTCPLGRQAKTTGRRMPDLSRWPARRTHGRTPRPAALLLAPLRAHPRAVAACQICAGDQRAAPMAARRAQPHASSRPAARILARSLRPARASTYAPRHRIRARASVRGPDSQPRRPSARSSSGSRRGHRPAPATFGRKGKGAPPPPSRAGFARRPLPAAARGGEDGGWVDAGGG